MDAIYNMEQWARLDNHDRTGRYEYPASWYSTANVCMADLKMGPSSAQAMQMFINWARANPRHWDKDQSFGLISALRENYPCP